MRGWSIRNIKQELFFLSSGSRFLANFMFGCLWIENTELKSLFCLLRWEQNKAIFENIDSNQGDCDQTVLID